MDEINNNMIQLYASLNKLGLNRMIEKVSNLKKKHIPQKHKWNQIWSVYVIVKVHFRAKKIMKAKERHNIMIKESVHQERTAILNVRAPPRWFQNT